jgi:hypothetical protein
LPILLLRKRKLRHSLGRPSRSDFVQLEVIQCLSFRKQPATATPNPRRSRTYPKKLFPYRDL